MALHRNSDAETATMTIELPTLKQRDVNVKANGKHLSIFLDFKRSENYDKANVWCENSTVLLSKSVPCKTF
ncbi:hypothetical protein CY34DRAFT_814030 [Suillus luteus UH-Slu-Lm8-n1]|uniref:Uncharacterized protein n=1 Tax=Suillus luteus UH-Slu-Lm8-n1 TaxID=930992 RepID=A0A0D0AF76_9AGAM|nr:hypothetical protein CY34DRAFT_814030 [Suillus luteus UH-Slu-Lm8-n1]